MASIRLIVKLSVGGLALLSATQPLLSEAGGGGGGGGGTSLPSDSAPQYDPVAEYQKGAAAFSAHDYKRAATAFKRVVDVLPKHAPAQYLLGASYLGQGDFKKARKPIETAVKLDANLIDAQRDLGVTYAGLGDMPKATAQRAALAQLKAACAGACADAAKLDAGLAAIDAALAGAPPQAMAMPGGIGAPGSIDRDYVSAVSLVNEGKYQPAVDTLERAVWRAGPHPDLLTYLGFANRKLKRFDVARGWYQEALAVAPTHRGALEYFGELKLETGDAAGAQAHLARLDRLCGFGCQQADELRRWIREAHQSAS